MSARDVLASQIGETEREIERYRRNNEEDLRNCSKRLRAIDEMERDLETLRVARTALE